MGFGPARLDGTGTGFGARTIDHRQDVAFAPVAEVQLRERQTLGDDDSSQLLPHPGGKGA